MTNIYKAKFFCARCGIRLTRGANVCHICDLSITSDAPFYKTAVQGSGGIGWSEKINDPRFNAYRKNNRIYIWIWTIALAVIIPVLLLAFGDFESLTEALTVGGIVFVMFVLIGFFSSLKTIFTGRQWEGNVIYKEVNDRKKSYISGNKVIQQVYTEYAVHVKTLNGKNIILTYKNDDTMYNYFNIGDRIRHHGKVKYIEKYDKSNDSIILCAACGYKSDIRADYCSACGCPLLKGRVF
ncbi:MAG: hypothetical protein ACYCWE_06555 [Eubacteriales bacterium]